MIAGGKKTMLRQRIADDVTGTFGSLDDPEVYGEPPGDPGLIGPGSVSWEIHSDPGTMLAAGAAAIIMEVMHPSVMAGVQDHSSYARDPFRRARTTAEYVSVTTYGSTTRAKQLIERVRRIHGRVTGVRPDGVVYRALDPELIAWVHTCIPWAIMCAFERHKRPLTPEERDRYLAEQAVIGRMGGADWVPETAVELDQYLDAMRPKLAITAQTRRFLDFMLTAPFGPRLPGRLDRLYHEVTLRGSLAVLPPWAARATGFDQPGLVRRLVIDPHTRVTLAAARWALGPAPARALAEARATEPAALVAA